MVVLGEAAEMVRQGLDALCEQRDLDLGRTGVAILGGVRPMTSCFVSRASGTRSSDTNMLNYSTSFSGGRIAAHLSTGKRGGSGNFPRHA